MCRDMYIKWVSMLDIRHVTLKSNVDARHYCGINVMRHNDIGIVPTLYYTTFISPDILSTRHSITRQLSFYNLHNDRT